MLLNKQKEVTKIALGVIKGNLKRSITRIKLTKLTDKTLQVKIRGGNAVQSMIVYTTDIETTTAAIAAMG